MTRGDSSNRNAPARAPQCANAGQQPPGRSRSAGDSSGTSAPARAPATTQDSDSSSRSAPARAPAPRS
eukprot:1003826-Rhodomonas_salina.1